MTRSAVDEMVERFKHSNNMRQMKEVDEYWISLNTRKTQDYLKNIIDSAILHRDKRHMDIRWVG